MASCWFGGETSPFPWACRAFGLLLVSWHRRCRLGHHPIPVGWFGALLALRVPPRPTPLPAASTSTVDFWSSFMIRRTRFSVNLAPPHRNKKAAASVGLTGLFDRRRRRSWTIRPSGKESGASASATCFAYAQLSSFTKTLDEILKFTKSTRNTRHLAH